MFFFWHVGNVGLTGKALAISGRWMMPWWKDLGELRKTDGIVVPSRDMLV